MGVKLVEYTIVDRDDYQIGKSYWFWCPGCKEVHRFTYYNKVDKRPNWKFNGDYQNPTFEGNGGSSSLKIFTTDPETKVETVICHLFLRKGELDFCGDCPHELKGQKVPLPDIPEDNWLVSKRYNQEKKQ